MKRKDRSALAFVGGLVMLMVIGCLIMVLAAQPWRDDEPAPGTVTPEVVPSTTPAPAGGTPFIQSTSSAPGPSYQALIAHDHGDLWMVYHA